jgi:hypothetical protein
VNETLLKKHRYRRQTIKCCGICVRHWTDPISNKIMCRGPLFETSIQVDFDGICKMYYPENMKIGGGA